MAKNTKICLYIKDTADRKTFEEAQRLFPFYLNKSVSQFCVEAVRDKVIKILTSNREPLKGAGFCIKCNAPVAQKGKGFYTCGIGRFDLCEKEKSK